MPIQRTKAEFKDRVHEWAKKLDVPVNRITVRHMSTKWASCSTNGNLTFNEDLLAVEPEVADYVVVHELLHIRVPNHGKLWKSLMTAHLGDYEAIARRLGTPSARVPVGQGEDAGWPKTANVFALTTQVLVAADNEAEGRERFEGLRRWLNDLGGREHEAARFLFPHRDVLHAMDDGRLEVPSGQPSSDRATTAGSSAATSGVYATTAKIDVVAEDEHLARARFGSFRLWLVALQERGHAGVRHAVAPILSDATAVVLDRQHEVDRGDLERLYRHGEAWFDRDDIGAFEERNVEAVFAYDARERLILNTDEETEAVRALEQTAVQLAQVGSDPYLWKWVIIALHNALQGFMVLALQGTWNIRVLKKADAKQLWEATERGDTEAMFKRYDLEFFLGLYEMIKKERHMNQYCHSKPFKPGGTHTRSVKRLNELRNEFVHFVPKSWSLAVEDLPRVVKDGTDVISFLVLESNNITWGTQAEMEDRTKELLDQIGHETRRLSDVYAREAAKFLGKDKASKLRIKP